MTTADKTRESEFNKRMFIVQVRTLPTEDSSLTVCNVFTVLIDRDYKDAQKEVV